MAESEMNDAFRQLKPICNPQGTESTSNMVIILCIFGAAIIGLLAVVIGAVLCLRHRKGQEPAAEEETGDVAPTTSTMEEGLTSAVDENVTESTLAPEEPAEQPSTIEDGGLTQSAVAATPDEDGAVDSSETPNEEEKEEPVPTDEKEKEGSAEEEDDLYK